MTPTQAQTETTHDEPKQTSLPAGRWLVDDRGQATPYVPWYVDRDGYAQPLEF